METLLLVEDNQSLGTFIQRALNNAGYDVLVATSGQLALEAAEHHADEIDLVLTDLFMEDMGGVEFARLLLVRRPRLRVLFMSGCLRSEAIQRGIAPSAPFLEKPFSPLQLTRTIREFLDHRPSPSHGSEQRPGARR